MLVSDIINRVRNIAGDTAVLQFTDDMLVDWINDGIRECAIDNNLLQKRATSQTAVGTKEYDLPTDILKLHSVTLNGVKLRGNTLQEHEEVAAGEGSSSDTGTPTSFYIWANSLTLFPTPDDVSTLVINYTYDPEVIPKTTEGKTLTPILPVGYHARLVDYCLAQVAQQDGDSNMYVMKMQEFRSGVQNLKDLPEYENDLYPFISISSRDMGSDYGMWYY